MSLAHFQEVIKGDCRKHETGLLPLERLADDTRNAQSNFRSEAVAHPPSHFACRMGTHGSLVLKESR